MVMPPLREISRRAGVITPQPVSLWTACRCLPRHAPSAAKAWMPGERRDRSSSVNTRPSPPPDIELKCLTPRTTRWLAIGDRTEAMANLVPQTIPSTPPSPYLSRAVS